MSILLAIGRLVRAVAAPSALIQLSPSAEKESAIKSATPSVGTIAAQFPERNCRYIPPQEQLVIRIHRPPVKVEGLAAYFQDFPALAQAAGNIEFRKQGLRLACLVKVKARRSASLHSTSEAVTLRRLV